MALQKLTKLFLIRKFAVVLGLIGNVGGNSLCVRLRHIRVGLNPNFLRMQERAPILRREDSVHNQVGKGLGRRI